MDGLLFESGPHRDFLPVDLHVHTPASADYKGRTSEDGYRDLLRRFKDSGVRVIAITDHNTLDGYREIVRLREAARTKVEVIAGLADDHAAMSDQLAELREELELFESLLILPGIELDAKPGVHVLAVFDPEVSLDPAEQLLLDAGFSRENQGREDKDSLASMSVDDILVAIEAAGGLSILAHVDRDKGAYKDLHGAYRARVLTCDSLSAISYVDPASEALLNDLLSQKEYRRTRPLAMFRCSDYHGEAGAPLRASFMQLPTLDFAGFRQVIEQPVGRVSQTADPGERAIIEEVARSKSSISFPNTDAVIRSGTEAACALLNQWGGGQLILGVGVKDGSVSVTGVSCTEKEARGLVRTAVEGVDPAPSIRVQFFKYGERLVAIATIVALGIGRLHVIKEAGEAWILDGGMPKAADASEIAQMVEENVIRRISEIQREPIAEARRFAAQAPILARSGRFFRLARKIEERSQSTFVDRVHGEYVGQGSGRPARLTARALEEHQNGLPSGSCGWAADGPYRYPNAYMRLTLPMFDMDDFEDGAAAALEMQGPFLVIVNQGAVYFMPQETRCSVFPDGASSHAVVLQGRSKRDSKYLARVALWMKSAPAIAYLLMNAAEGRPEQGGPSLYSRLPLPEALFGSDASDLDQIAASIAALEVEFLGQPAPPSQAEHWELVDRHNLAVDKYAYEAEAVIAVLLGLDEDDATALDDFLKSRRLYALDAVDAATGRGIQAAPTV